MDNFPKWAWIVVLVVVIGGGWYLFKGGAAPTETGPIVIGASLPLSGDTASFGEMTKAGIEVAVKEINDAGGVDGRMIEVIYEDDKCSVTGSAVFNKFTSVDHVAAIIGPVCSPAASAGVPIAQEAKTPTIIWGSAPGITKAGNFIFRTYPSDAFQGKYGAEYIYNTLGKRTVAVIYVNNDWGQGLSESFTKRFTELGGTVTIAEGVKQDSTDVRTVVSKVKATNPELVYAPMFPAGGVQTIKEARALGLDVPFFGGDGFDTKDFTGATEVEGTLFTVGKVNQSDAFKARVKAETGVDAGLFTPLGYDAIKILAQVIDKTGTDSEAMRAELTKLSYTGGESFPLISFDADRDLKEVIVEVKEAKGGVAVPYTP